MKKDLHLLVKSVILKEKKGAIMPVVTEDKRKVLSTALSYSVHERLQRYCHSAGMKICRFVEAAIVAALKKAIK